MRIQANEGTLTILNEVGRVLITYPAFASLLLLHFPAQKISQAENHMHECDDMRRFLGPRGPRLVLFTLRLQSCGWVKQDPGTHG